MWEALKRDKVIFSSDIFVFFQLKKCLISLIVL